MSVNKVILLGNVGGDPEVRYLDSGTPLAKFGLATSESYTNKNGEKVTTTEWHNVVLWRGLAEVAEKYVKKGSQLYIEGRIRTRNYDDKDGNKRYITEITGDVMQMVGKRGETSGSSGDIPPPPPPPPTQGGSNNNSSSGGTNASAEPDGSDDLPF